MATGLNQLETSGNFGDNLPFTLSVNYHTAFDKPLSRNPSNYSATQCHCQAEHLFEHDSLKHKLPTDGGCFAILPADPPFALVDPILNGAANGLQPAVSS